MTATQKTIYFFTALGITLVIVRVFIFDSFIVTGNSMSPVIQSGDYVFVNKLAYTGDKKPLRGEVVVGKFRDIDAKVIKRVVGLPREWVYVEEGVVYSGDSREKKGEEVHTFSNIETRNTEVSRYRLDPFEYYVVGDNDRLSADSRDYGPIDSYNIDGKVMFLFRTEDFSWNKL